MASWILSMGLVLSHAAVYLDSHQHLQVQPCCVGVVPADHELSIQLTDWVLHGSLRESSGIPYPIALTSLS